MYFTQSFNIWNNTNNNYSINEHDTTSFEGVVVFQLRIKWPFQIVITYSLLMFYCIFITGKLQTPY